MINDITGREILDPRATLSLQGVNNLMFLQNWFSWSHSMSRTIWIKVNSSWLLLPQHQSTYPRGPESASNKSPSYPFQTQIYLVKVPLNVNIVKQDLLNNKQFLKILWSEVWKVGFWLIQILGLLGMYFDAVVVDVHTFLILFRLALAMLCTIFYFILVKYVFT